MLSETVHFVPDLPYGSRYHWTGHVGTSRQSRQLFLVVSRYHPLIDKKAPLRGLCHITLISCLVLFSMRLLAARVRTYESVQISAIACGTSVGIPRGTV